jgi:hypothetical protein
MRYLNELVRKTRAIWPEAPTTPADALRHTLAICSDHPDDDMAVTATSGVYGSGVRTGLTWGDLRALAALLDPAEPEPALRCRYCGCIDPQCEKCINECAQPPTLDDYDDGLANFGQPRT